MIFDTPGKWGELLVLCELLVMLVLALGCLVAQLRNLWRWRGSGDGLEQHRLMIAFATFAIVLLALQRGAIWFDALLYDSRVFGLPSQHWPSAAVVWGLELVAVAWYVRLYYVTRRLREKLNEKAAAGELEDLKEPELQEPPRSAHAASEAADGPR